MRTVSQAVQWLATIFVIRLLTPADYGLVAMAAAFHGLVYMFCEFGLGAAIIQRRTLSTSQIARLGGVSLISSSLLAVLSVAVSGLVAGFFDEPRVRLIVIVLSSTFLFTGASVVPRALLMRDREFMRLAWVQASFNLTYAITSLSLAALGFEYWSLVWAGFFGAFVSMVVGVTLRRHPIAWPTDIASIESELWFGWHVVVSRFGLYIRKFSDILIVGRLFGIEALGAYNVAWTQANLPVDRGTSVITELTSSIFAAVQDDVSELRRYIRVFTEGIAFLAFPATFGMAVVADDFVLLVFGEQWTATIGPLRALAFVGAMRSITPILTKTLVATDQAKKSMHFAMIAAVAMPAFFLIGSNWGITGVAMGWLIGHPVVISAVLLPPVLRTADMRLREYLDALRPALLGSLAMVTAVVGVRVLMPADWPLAVRFAVEVSAGVVVYGLVVLIVYRTRFWSFLSVIRAQRQGDSNDG